MDQYMQYKEIRKFNFYNKLLQWMLHCDFICIEMSIGIEESDYKENGF